MLSVSGKVNAKLLARLKNDADAPYHGKKLEFSSSSTKAPSVFPTLSVVSLGETSSHDDLEMDFQNCIVSTIELKAFTDTTLYDAQKLLDKAGDVMQRMSYSLIYGAETLSDTKPYCKVARFRRNVGRGDII